jgi:hypothetical protein
MPSTEKNTEFFTSDKLSKSEDLKEQQSLMDDLTEEKQSSNNSDKTSQETNDSDSCKFVNYQVEMVVTYIQNINDDCNNEAII